jgi:hypothetical protein
VGIECSPINYLDHGVIASVFLRSNPGNLWIASQKTLAMTPWLSHYYLEFIRYRNSCHASVLLAGIQHPKRVYVFFVLCCGMVLQGRSFCSTKTLQGRRVLILSAFPRCSPRIEYRHKDYQEQIH